MQTTSIFDNFIDLAKSFTKVYPIAAIWLNKPVQTTTERTVRITKGHLIRVRERWIEDVTDTLPATHKVIECKGTIGDSVLFFELANLETQELSTLNVK